MAVRFTNSITSFKSGRLSPKLFNRVDTKQYSDGCSVLENFRVLPEGGAEKPKGIRYINEGFFSPLVLLDNPRMIPININGNQLVGIIESQGGNTQVTFLRYPYKFGVSTIGAPLVSADTDPKDWDWAIVDNDIILTHFSGTYIPRVIRFNSDATIYDSGTYLEIAGVYNGLPMTDYEGNYTLDIANATATTIEITSTDLEAVRRLQESTTCYLEGIGNKDFGDGNLSSYIASNFYRKDVNIVGGIRAFYSLRYSASNTEALTYGAITSVQLFKTNIWRTGNYPKTVTNHDGRIVFGGTPDNPLNIFGSSVTNPYRINTAKYANPGMPLMNVPHPSSPIVGTDPYNFKISSKECNEITFIRNSGELVIGTDRKEYVATGGDTGLSSISVSIKPQTGKGSFPLSSIAMDGAIAFTSSTRKKLFMFKYSERNGSFVSTDLTLLFNDLMDDDRIKELLWAAHLKVLYILTDSGKFYGITYDVQTDTTAFFDTKLDNIQSMTYVPAREDPDDARVFHRGDHVLILQSYTANTIGFGPLPSFRLMSYEDTFLELGVEESGVKVATANRNAYAYLSEAFRVERVNPNAYWVNGQLFTPASDLFVIPEFSPISNGFPSNHTEFYAYNVDTEELITLDTLVYDNTISAYVVDDPRLNGASSVIFGNRHMAATLASMPIEKGMQYGTAQLGIKNIDELGIRFYKSYSYDISSDGIKYQEVRVADKLGNNVTGREETKISSNPKYDQVIWIQSDKPEPLTITGVNYRGVSNDG